MIPLSTVLSLCRAASGGALLRSWGYFAASSSLFFFWNMVPIFVAIMEAKVCPPLLFFQFLSSFFKRAAYHCKQKTTRLLGNGLLKAHGVWRLIQARAVGDSSECWLIWSSCLKAKAESFLCTPICTATLLFCVRISSHSVALSHHLLQCHAIITSLNSRIKKIKITPKIPPNHNKKPLYRHKEKMLGNCVTLIRTLITKFPPWVLHVAFSNYNMTPYFGAKERGTTF